MSDQVFDVFGNRVVIARDAALAEPATDNPSRFLARFGVIVFWVLAVAIVSARVFIGV